jgi:hypothetical protein
VSDEIPNLELVFDQAESDRIAEETITGQPPGTELPPEVIERENRDVSERYLERDGSARVEEDAPTVSKRFDEDSPSPSSEPTREPEPERAADHTWRPLDLIALGAEPPSPPEIGGLFYAGRRHVVSGEFDTGKSWLMAAVASSEVRADHGVIWIDDDDMGPSAILERLRALDLEDERIAGQFAYLRPAEPLSDAARRDVVELIHARAVRLVVFDAFNATLSQHRCDPNSSADVERFLRSVVSPFASEGAAVVLPDHVVKQREARGRYSYGSERKQTGVDVHLGLSVIEPLGRGRTGKAKISVHKDRAGFLEPALFVLTSDPETGKCSWRIELDHAVSDEGDFRPTNLMEKVSRYLELAGEPRSRNQVEQDVKGKSEYVRQAIDVLISESFAVEFKGERGARMVKLVRAFREADEWEEE